MPLSRRSLLIVQLLAFPTLTIAVELFRREPKLAHKGVSQEGTVELAPRSLVMAFGEPTDESWDTESLGAYYFVSQDEQPFSVYYRAYDKSASEVRRLRRDFWNESAEYEFSIGAKGQSRLVEFKAWLQAKVVR